MSALETAPRPSRPSVSGVETALRRALFDESQKHVNFIEPSNHRSYRCAINGCVRWAYAKSFCNTHYMRLKKGAEMLSPIRNRRANQYCVECDAPVSNKGGFGRCAKHYRRHRAAILKDALIECFGGVCEICRLQFPSCVFDFHHHGEKSDPVSLLCASGSLRRIAEEAIKCLLLCANCHRVHHHGHI